mmetsp:Transcript_28352/g.91734  ORF Transcript_28352/g.91734 Transcript_28352/m.91734 type:complete len:422 (+) Transcript_28352:212-1477(+)
MALIGMHTPPKQISPPLIAPLARAARRRRFVRGSDGAAAKAWGRRRWRGRRTRGTLCHKACGRSIALEYGRRSSSPCATHVRGPDAHGGARVSPVDPAATGVPPPRRRRARGSRLAERARRHRRGHVAAAAQGALRRAGLRRPVVAAALRGVLRPAARERRRRLPRRRRRAPRDLPRGAVPEPHGAGHLGRGRLRLDRARRGPRAGPAGGGRGPRARLARGQVGRHVRPRRRVRQRLGHGPPPRRPLPAGDARLCRRAPGAALRVHRAPARGPRDPHAQRPRAVDPHVPRGPRGARRRRLHGRRRRAAALDAGPRDGLRHDLLPLRAQRPRRARHAPAPRRLLPPGPRRRRAPRPRPPPRLRGGRRRRPPRRARAGRLRARGRVPRVVRGEVAGARAAAPRMYYTGDGHARSPIERSPPTF